MLSSSTLFGTSNQGLAPGQEQGLAPGHGLAAGQGLGQGSTCDNGTCRPCDNVRAGVFIDRVSRSRISSNFPRLFS